MLFTPLILSRPTCWLHISDYRLLCALWEMDYTSSDPFRACHNLYNLHLKEHNVNPLLYAFVVYMYDLGV